MLCLKACLGTKKTLNFLMSWEGNSVASESTLLSGGWMWTGQKDMCTDWPVGNQAGCSFFSLPSLLCFFPFSWGFYSWKTGVKHWKYWKLGMAEEQNITSLTCWVLGFYSLGYSVTPGLAWESLVFFLCYFALSSPPMQVVLPAAV